MCVCVCVRVCVCVSLIHVPAVIAAVCFSEEQEVMFCVV